MGVSLYTTSLDPGLFDRRPSTPPEFCRRSVGRPAGESVRSGDQISIHWPDTPDERSRRIISRSGGRRRYIVPCHRDTERKAHGESSEEATAYVILDACHGVIFQEQPARLEFEWRKERIDHYPDALVVTSNVKEFWEFKKDHEAKDVLYRRRSERLIELLKPLGYGYRLVSTATLMRGFYYRNAMEMRRRSKLARTLADWQAVLSRLKARAPAPAHLVLADLPEAQRIDVLLAALYAGELSTDFSVPITFDARIHPPLSTSGGDPWAWELFEKGS